METGTFKSFDNADIFYRVWNYNPSQKTIVILHRGHEHSGRLQAFAENEQFVHFNIFGFDMRGLGHTSQSVSPHFMDYVRDLDAFVKSSMSSMELLRETSLWWLTALQV